MITYRVSDVDAVASEPSQVSSSSTLSCPWHLCHYQHIPCHMSCEYNTAAQYSHWVTDHSTHELWIQHTAAQYSHWVTDHSTEDKATWPIPWDDHPKHMFLIVLQGYVQMWPQVLTGTIAVLTSHIVTSLRRLTCCAWERTDSHSHVIFQLVVSEWFTWRIFL